MVAFLEKPEESDGFAQIIDFLKASSVSYALTVNSGDLHILHLTNWCNCQALEKAILEVFRKEKISRLTGLKRHQKVGYGQQRVLVLLKDQRVWVFLKIIQTGEDIADIDVDVEYAFTTVGDDSAVSYKQIGNHIGSDAYTKIKAAKPKEPSEFRVPQEIKPSSSKDKGKGIMIEPKVPLKRKDQIALDEQIARDIQAKLMLNYFEEQKLQKTIR
ncbi:hypothetical protein Tco_0266194 [Tanacetum coccineum]